MTAERDGAHQRTMGRLQITLEATHSRITMMNAVAKAEGATNQEITLMRMVPSIWRRASKVVLLGMVATSVTT